MTSFLHPRRARWRGARWPGVLFGCAGVAAVLAVGMGSLWTGTTTIRFSVSLDDAEVPAVRQLLDRFEAENGVRVDLVRLSGAADLPKVLERDRATGRRSVHLFAQDNGALDGLVGGRLLGDVSDVPIPAEVTRSLTPELFEGKQFFLPFRPNVRLGYARRGAFPEGQLPETVALLRSAAQRLHDEAGGRALVTLSLAPGAPAAVTLSELILGFGGEPAVLNDEGSVAAFEFLRGMWRDGLLAGESLLGRFDTEIANLESGTSWLAENWAYTSASLASAGRLDEFHVYPGWRGPRGRIHVVGGDVLGVPAGLTAAERRAALGLARFLMSKSSQEHLARLNAWPAIRDDAYAVDRRLCSRGRGRCVPWSRAAPTSTASRVPAAPPPPCCATLHAPTFKAIRTALREGWYRPVAPWWPKVESEMTAATRRILEGGEPVRQVLDEAHAAIAAAARDMGAEYPGP